MKAFISSILLSVMVLLVACTTSNTANIGSKTSQQDAKVASGLSASAGALQAGAASMAVNPYLAAGILIPKGAQEGFKMGSLELPTEELVAAGGAAYQLGHYVTIILPSDKVFVPGTHDTTREADQLIKAAVRIIKAFPDDSILVTAHTDGIGSQLWQAKLSYAQAKTVALKLWSMGAIRNEEFSRYHYAGVADTQPVANAKSGRGMMLNRHVAITLYPYAEQSRLQGAIEGLGVGEMKVLDYQGY